MLDPTTFALPRANYLMRSGTMVEQPRAVLVSTTLDGVTSSCNEGVLSLHDLSEAFRTNYVLCRLLDMPPSGHRAFLADHALELEVLSVGGCWVDGQPRRSVVKWHRAKGQWVEHTEPLDVAAYMRAAGKEVSDV
jgi:hypothetical protein